MVDEPAVTTPAALPPLAADAVHVWRLPWHASRAQREAALLAALSRYLAAGATPRLVREPGGRPLLADAPPDLHFGVSHSGDEFLVAVARTAVGVDVERPGRRRRYREIAQQYFAPEELARIDAVVDDPPALERVFLTLWVAKEALLKANGMGIAGGLRQLWVDDDHGAPVLRRAPAAFGEPSRWCVRWFAPRGDAVAAVASDGVCGELLLVDASR